MSIFVLQSGTVWGTLHLRSRSGVAGLLPLRHPGSTEPTDFALLDMSLGLPRHLRTLARRQEPADRPGQVPGRAGGEGVSRARRRPLHLALPGGDLHGADGGRAVRPEPVLAPGPRA